MSTSTVDQEVVDLVERAKAGDGQAFAALYDRYVNQIFGFIYNKVRDRPRPCGEPPHGWSPS